MVEKVTQRKVKKFSTTGMDYKVRFDNLQGNNGERLPVDELEQRILLSLQEMLNRLLQGINGNDFVRIVINNNAFDLGAINLPFMRRDQLNLDAILAAIMDVLKSNEEYEIDGILDVNLIHVEVPIGARTKISYASAHDKIKKSKSIIQVKNTDNMCLARSIVIVKGITDGNSKYKSIIQSMPMQTRLSKALCLAAGVDHTKPCGYDELQKF